MSLLKFDRQFDITYGDPETVADTVVRVVAPNPNDYTFTGTNTYVVGSKELAIIDPGPAIDYHLDALMAVIDGRPVKAVLVTHSHLDHSPGAAVLKERTGATVYGQQPLDPQVAALTDEDVDVNFRADQVLYDGDELRGTDWTLETVHTPGHFPNHLCFSLREQRILFSGDQVMGWASTVVNPPLGNLGQYLESLQRLRERDEDVYLPSHGPSIANAREYVARLIDHRRARGRQIDRCLARGIYEPAAIVDEIYEGLTPRLVIAARQSVVAYLDYLKSCSDDFDGEPWLGTSHGTRRMADAD